MNEVSETTIEISPDTRKLFNKRTLSFRGSPTLSEVSVDESDEQSKPPTTVGMGHFRNKAKINAYVESSDSLISKNPFVTDESPRRPKSAKARVQKTSIERNSAPNLNTSATKLRKSLTNMEPESPKPPYSDRGPERRMSVAEELEGCREIFRSNLQGMTASYKINKAIQEKNIKRQNIIAYINSLNVEDARTKFQKELEEIRRSFETQIGAIQQDRDQWKWKAEKSQMDFNEIIQQLDSEKHINDMLRKKLQKLTERELLHQRKLRVNNFEIRTHNKTFAKLEPVFEKLSEKFHFNTPEDIINRFEALERTHLESYTDMLEVREQKNQLERELQVYKKDKENEFYKQYVDLSRSLEKSERQVRELQNELESHQKFEVKTESVREKYLGLSTSILELWQKWHKSDLLQTNLQESELPNLNEPADIIAAMHNLFTMHSPSAAAKRLRDLNGLANTLWVRHFPDDLELKSKPRSVYLHMSKVIDQKTAEIDRLKRVLNGFKEEKRRMKQEIRDLERERRRLQSEQDRAISRELAIDKEAKPKM